MAEEMRILFSNNSAWSVYNFRRKMLAEIRESMGCEIHVLCPWDEVYSNLLKEEGFVVHRLDFHNNDASFSNQIRLFLKYRTIYKQIAPDVILHNAILPNIYGSLAARLNGIPVINNVSGLGSAFIKGGLTWKLIKILYKLSQRKADHIFFQNEDDQAYFVQHILGRRTNYSLLPGSGVDIVRFHPKHRTFGTNDSTELCFVGRVIKDKGVVEYVDAIKILRSKGVDAKFHILGGLDEMQITGISRATVSQWESDGLIIYHAQTDSPELELGKYDAIVLPSYREGMSRVLLEASSSGVPIITTNVPGCRQAVIADESGFLCEPKDVNSLQQAILKLLGKSKGERLQMGDRGRKLAEDTFDEKWVVGSYLDQIKKLTQSN
ncbi:MAG: glycosyltransferase family 1 protein [Bacteroidetes bacterium]|nr:MAG: glycosyltransferase family 1 protein [Bacteroidota bacterium]